MQSRMHIHSPKEASAKIADTITSFLGSWWCIGLHALWFVLWFVLRQNIDVLTLIVSLEAIFLSAFVMMSQSRSGQRDKLRDDLEADEVDLLLKLQQEQLEILRRLPNV